MARGPRLYWQLAAGGTLIAGMLVAAAAYGPLQPRRYTLDRMKRDLEVVPAARIAERVAEIGERGDEGVLLLVDYLEHPRSEVARAAREVVDQQVSSWSLLSPTESSPRIARLMGRIAARVDGFGGEGKRYSQRIAHQVLVWPFDSQSVNVAQILSDCETVLKIAAPSDAHAPLVPAGTTPTSAARRRDVDLPGPLLRVPVLVPRTESDDP